MTAAPAERDRVELVPNAGWDPRILVCRCAPTVDAFIVVTARYVVLIDTLINPATARAMLAIAQEHLTDGRSLLVVNTHADWDHCWGNQLFAGPDAEASAPIVSSRRCAERFRSQEAAPLLRQMQEREPGRFDAVHYAPPTILFDERLTIDGGDLTLDLFLTPGHTPDHIAIHLPEIGTVLAGDAAEFPFPFARSADALPQLRASLARLAALKPTAALYCHAPETSGPALIAEISPTSTRWNRAAAPPWRAARPAKSMLGPTSKPPSVSPSQRLSPPATRPTSHPSTPKGTARTSA